MINFLAFLPQIHAWKQVIPWRNLYTQSKWGIQLHLLIWSLIYWLSRSNICEEVFALMQQSTQESSVEQANECALKANKRLAQYERCGFGTVFTYCGPWCSMHATSERGKPPLWRRIYVQESRSGSWPLRSEIWFSWELKKPQKVNSIFSFLVSFIICAVHTNDDMFLLKVHHSIQTYLIGDSSPYSYCSKASHDESLIHSYFFKYLSQSSGMILFPFTYIQEHFFFS